MLLVAIARREIQTEGLNSPPLGLGAAFLSAKIKVPPGAWHPSHLPRRTDCGLQEGSRRIPAPSKGKGCPASQGMAKQVTAGVGRMHQPLLYAPRATPHSLTAPLFPRCTFFREKKKSHNLLELVRLSRQVKPHLGQDRWQRFGIGSAVGGQRPARGADSVQGRRENTSGRMTYLLLVLKK